MHRFISPGKVAAGHGQRQERTAGFAENPSPELTAFALRLKERRPAALDKFEDIPPDGKGRALVAPVGRETCRLEGSRAGDFGTGALGFPGRVDRLMRGGTAAGSW